MKCHRAVGSPFNLQQPPAWGAAELRKRNQAEMRCAGSSSPSAPCKGELDECRAPLSLQTPLQAAGASPRRAVCVLVQRGWFKSLGHMDMTLEDKVRARSLEHRLVCSSLLARHTRGNCPSQADTIRARASLRAASTALSRQCSAFFSAVTTEEPSETGTQQAKGVTINLVQEP